MTMTDADDDLHEHLRWLQSHRAVVRFTDDDRLRLSVPLGDEVATTFVDIDHDCARALLRAVADLRPQLDATDRRRQLRVV